MLIIENPVYGTKFEVAEIDCYAGRSISSGNVFNFWEAHKACKSLGKGWRLPQKGELEMMYHQLHCNAVGSFTSTFYWSKSIHIDGEKQRWCFSFETGMFNVALLSNNYMYVRAVRPL